MLYKSMKANNVFIIINSNVNYKINATKCFFIFEKHGFRALLLSK